MRSVCRIGSTLTLHLNGHRRGPYFQYWRMRHGGREIRKKGIQRAQLIAELIKLDPSTCNRNSQRSRFYMSSCIALNKGKEVRKPRISLRRVIIHSLLVLAESPAGISVKQGHSKNSNGYGKAEFASQFRSPARNSFIRATFDV